MLGSRNPTIFNIICWVTGSMGQLSHWPSCECPKSKPATNCFAFKLSRWYLDHQRLGQWDNWSGDLAYYIEDCQISGAIPDCCCLEEEAYSILSGWALSCFSATSMCHIGLEMTTLLRIQCTTNDLWTKTFQEITSLLIKLWIVDAHLFAFCHHFWVGATAKQQQTHSKVMTEWICLQILTWIEWSHKLIRYEPLKIMTGYS